MGYEEELTLILNVLRKRHQYVARYPPRHTPPRHADPCRARRGEIDATRERYCQEQRYERRRHVLRSSQAGARQSRLTPPPGLRGEAAHKVLEARVGPGPYSIFGE